MGRCRFPMCRTADSAAAAPAPSIPLPTARSARSLRPRRPNRSADAGSCIPPAEKRYVDRARSRRGPVGVAIVQRRASSTRNDQSMNAEKVSQPKYFEIRALIWGSTARNPNPRKYGTALKEIIVPQSWKYQRSAPRRSNGTIDDSVNRVYAL